MESDHLSRLVDEYKSSRDIATMSEIVRLSNPLIHSVVGRIKRRLPRFVDRLDLIQDASIGLVLCVDKFSFDSGRAFLSYAAERMAGAVVDGLRRRDRAKRYRRRLDGVLKDVIEQIYKTTGEVATDEQIMEEMDRRGERTDMSPHEYQMPLEISCLSYDSVVSDLACSHQDPCDADESMLARNAMDQVFGTYRAVLYYRTVHGMSVPRITVINRISDTRCIEISNSLRRLLRDPYRHDPIGSPSMGTHFFTQAQENSLIESTMTVINRNGEAIPFDASRIQTAIQAGFNAADIHITSTKLDLLVGDVCNEIMSKHDGEGDGQIRTIEVEEIQDIVESALMTNGHHSVARAYIVHRSERAKLRNQTTHKVLTEDTARFKEDATRFSNDLGVFQFLGKYSRWIDEKSRRETWSESADRVVEFLRWHVTTKLQNADVDPESWADLRESILNFQAFPSMRSMQMAGPAAQRCNVCTYNCAFLTVDSLESFAEALYILMQGTGVGFSVESEHVEDLPKIKRQKKGDPVKYIIEDSTPGWCDSVLFGLRTWFAGGDVEYDYSQIREAGAKLKTKGGRASGPEPLRELHVFMRKLILSRQRKRLRPIDAHDIMCKIGKIVQVGGVRRAAMISLSDLEDGDMRTAKHGQFWSHAEQRTMANNTSVYEERPSDKVFLSEWKSLVDSGSGERGICNRYSMQRGNPRRKKTSKIIGTNPCVTGDSWVLRADGGPCQVRDLVNKPFFAMVDGESFASKGGFFPTGTKPVFAVKLSNGMQFKATENHRILVVSHQSRKVQRTQWKEVGDLTTRDRVVMHNHRESKGWGGDGNFEQGWLLGMLNGDGTYSSTDCAHLDIWGDNRQHMRSIALEYIQNNCDVVGGTLNGCDCTGEKVRISSKGLANLAENMGLSWSKARGKQLHDHIEEHSAEFHAGFLRGWFDADGSVQGNHIKGVSVRLASSDLRGLYRAQRMLARLGVISTVYQERRPAGPRYLPDGKGDYTFFECAADHELVISNDNLQVYADRVGFHDPAKQSVLMSHLSSYQRVPNRERFCSHVSSVEACGEEVVYDCQVEEVHAFDANGCYLHNCGEILLRNKQFCNLSIAVVRPDDTRETLHSKVRLAAIFGTIQSSMTSFRYISEKWAENCEEERLLGVDLCGAIDCPLLRPGAEGREQLLEDLKQAVIDVNAEWAQKLGINPSVATTCIKPSGNSSLLFGTGNAMTGWYSKYIKRNVRCNTIDPMCQFLIDQGVEHAPDYDQDPQDPRVMVFAFPVRAPEGIMTKDDMTAIEQLENWKAFKVHYTEHNPSVTIYVGEDEWVEVGNWVLKNWDVVGGLAFLPRDSGVYQLAPNIPMEEEEFNAFEASFPKIRWDKFPKYENEDHTTVSQEFACVSGACEI